MATGYGRRVRRLQQDFVSGKAPTAPAAWYLAASTANPGDDASGLAEPTATGGYVRKQMPTAADWTAAPNPSNDAAAVAANANIINFAASSAAWSTGATNITYLAIFDHPTNTAEANYIGRAILATPQAVNSSGVTLSIAIGALTMNNTSS